MFYGSLPWNDCIQQLTTCNDCAIDNTEALAHVNPNRISWLHSRHKSTKDKQDDNINLSTRVTWRILERIRSSAAIG